MLSTENIATAPIQVLIAERNVLMKDGFKSIAKVLSSIIEERIETLTDRLEGLELLKQRMIEDDNLLMLPFVRNDSEYFQKKHKEAMVMVDIYHIFGAIKLQIEATKYCL